MWRNTVMVEFVDWLRGWNFQPDHKNDRAGIFGMDLYSLHASMESVLGYLDKADPEAPAVRVTATAVSIISAKTASLTVTPPRGPQANLAKPKWWRSWSNCAEIW